MAKFLGTAIVADIRNKINGSVFSKNRYGGYIRTKVTPVNPNTVYQQEARANLGALSSQWRGLTQSQRNSWIDAAPNFPFTDIFGNAKILSGQALFVKLNLNLVSIGSSTIVDAPSAVSFDSFSITTASVTSGGAKTLTISPAAIPADFEMLVYATPSIPAGIAFVKNRYRLLGAFTVVAGVATLTTAYDARFSADLASGNVSLKAVFISNDSGQMSQASTITTPVIIV